MTVDELLDLRHWATKELLRGLKVGDTLAIKVGTKILLVLAQRRSPKIKPHIPTDSEIDVWESMGFNPLQML